ncbi:MAG: hypothetical protein HOM21_00830, partial [Halobacteriovoraceae bacterium]|nr:hypothetical protein [Halobacteriovoraceae bacterium]
MENFFVKKLVGVVVAIGTSAMIILIFQNFSDSHLTVIPDLGSRQALPKEPIHEGMELVKIEPFLQLDTTVVLKTYYKIKKGWKWYRDCRINVPGVGEVDAIAYHYNSIIYSGPELNGDANWFKWVWGPKFQDCPGEYKEKYFLGQSHIKNAPRFTSDNLLELTDSQTFFYNGVDYKISLVKKKYPQICVKGGIVDQCERYSYND